MYPHDQTSLTLNRHPELPCVCIPMTKPLSSSIVTQNCLQLREPTPEPPTSLQPPVPHESVAPADGRAGNLHAEAGHAAAHDERRGKRRGEPARGDRGRDAKEGQDAPGAGLPPLLQHLVEPDVPERLESPLVKSGGSYATEEVWKSTRQWSRGYAAASAESFLGNSAEKMAPIQLLVSKRPATKGICQSLWNDHPPVYFAFLPAPSFLIKPGQSPNPPQRSQLLGFSPFSVAAGAGWIGSAVDDPSVEA